MDKAEFLQYLNKLVDEAGTQKALAEKLGINQAYLSDILAERRDPADKILTALGMERVVTYRFVEAKKGESVNG
jgi:hypothetical protein